jgi:hypothetical protein
MRLPRELWMMVLEWKRKWAWAERKERVSRVLDAVMPVELIDDWEMGIYYVVTPMVEFIVEYNEEDELRVVIHQDIRIPKHDEWGLMNVRVLPTYGFTVF